MRLLSYNIRYGGVGREGALAAVLRAAAPDVVVLQEATRPAVVERLAGLAGLPSWGARSGHSLAFLARAAPAHHDWHWPRSSRHAFLELVAAGSTLRIVGVHLSAVHAAWTERRRMGEVRALLSAIDAHRREPHVLVGDFNTLAPGQDLDMRRLPPRLRPFVWLSGGRVRWQVVTHMLAEGYVDVFRSLHASDPGYTFPTWDPHLRLDYAFAPAPQLHRFTRCAVVRDPPDAVREGSDHCGLLVEGA